MRSFGAAPGRVEGVWGWSFSPRVEGLFVLEVKEFHAAADKSLLRPILGTRSTAYINPALHVNLADTSVPDATTARPAAPRTHSLSLP